MFRVKNLIALIACFTSFSGNVLARDPFQQPFASNSIWNTPIGSNAKYIDAEIQAPTGGAGMFIEEDIIILTPDAPLTPIFLNKADWNWEAGMPKDRCCKQGKKIGDFPIPKDFVVSSDLWIGDTPNHATAILLKDKRYIFQTIPFSRCLKNKYATSHYIQKPIDICGDGILGTHGGSGLSSIGGTIRLGELKKGSTIKHALKVNIFGDKYLHFDKASKKGFRWPAIRNDSYASSRYGGDIPGLKMGSLLALKTDFNINKLKTEPAKIVAQAFIDYGGYVVDDSAWDVYGIALEWSPDGRVLDEFREEWGFDFYATYPYDSRYIYNDNWVNDMESIFTNLHVIDNNSKDNIGGGGTPRQPLAPELNCKNI